MTHKFKVGDKGKTRGGDETAEDNNPQNYEVIAVDKKLVDGKSVVAVVGGFAYEFYADGSTHGPETDYWLDLIPPKRRIQGWKAFGKSTYDGGKASSHLMDTREEAMQYFKGGWETIACIYIDIEEGEGLD